MPCRSPRRCSYVLHVSVGWECWDHDRSKNSNSITHACHELALLVLVARHGRHATQWLWAAAAGLTNMHACVRACTLMAGRRTPIGATNRPPRGRVGYGGSAGRQPRRGNGMEWSRSRSRSRHTVIINGPRGFAAEDAVTPRRLRRRYPSDREASPLHATACSACTLMRPACKRPTPRHHRVLARIGYRIIYTYSRAPSEWR